MLEVDDSTSTTRERVIGQINSLAFASCWYFWRWKRFFYRQANPTAPSPVIAVSKQQLLTLPEGG